MSLFLHLWSIFTLQLKVFTGCFAIHRKNNVGELVNSTPAKFKIRDFFVCFYGFVSFMPYVWAETEKVPPAKPHFIEQMMPFIFIFVLFYFLLIRPAQKRQKKHQNLVNQLKKGDSVITSSGILGIIYGLTDSFVTLEVADNVRIRVLRSQISSLVEPDTDKK